MFAHRDLEKDNGMASSTHLTLQEIDGSSGQVIKSYILSKTSTPSNNINLRLDRVPLRYAAAPESVSPQKRSAVLPISSLTWLYLTTLLTYLKTLFLPSGYPHTVTADYTPYQVYDSIQAFASSIAGLLSSRAVLQSLNVISSSSSTNDSTSPSPTSTQAATAATLLSILQSTLANLTTILFASHAAPRISANVKFYRLLADVVNDAAFILDLLAPSLPNSLGDAFTYVMLHTPPTFKLWSHWLFTQHLGFLTASATAASLTRLPFLPTLSSWLLCVSPRILALCTSSILRAICGVSAGSSKAVLSAHFARNHPENIGDLNAKDGSQETVVNLLGMWIGGVVVSRVEGVAATWTSMVILLICHLWANWKAVGSVRLRGLNRERGMRVCKVLVGRNEREVDWEDVGVEQVGRNEGTLGVRRWVGRLIGSRAESGIGWKIGVSIEEFVDALVATTAQRRMHNAFKMEGGKGNDLSRLIEVFEQEFYILWIDAGSGKVTVMFKEGASGKDQLKALYHGHVACQMPVAKVKELQLVMESLENVKANWGDLCSGLTEAGWDLALTNLEDAKGIRVVIGGGRNHDL